MKYLWILFVFGLGLSFFLAEVEADMNLKEVLEKTHSVSVDAKTALKVRLTIPQTQQKKLPALLLLEGSGKSPRKEESAGDPFKRLAHELSRNGFIVARFNKRGSGVNHDQGLFKDATLSTHQEDARAVFQFLASQPAVDSDNLFVFGQSMGGLRATQLAGEFPQVRGLVLFAAPLISPKKFPFADFNRDQLAPILKYVYKMDSAQISATLKRNEDFLKDIQDDQLDCESYKGFQLSTCEVADGEIYVDGSTIRYYQEVMQVDQVQALKQVRAPVLLFGGQSDWVVPFKNVERAAAVLATSGHDSISLKIYKDLDHVFARNESVEESVAYMFGVAQGKRDFQPLHSDFLADLLQWLRQTKK